RRSSASAWRSGVPARYRRLSWPFRHRVDDEFGPWLARAAPGPWPGGSEDRRLSPDAPDLAQGVAHLAHGDLLLGGLDHPGHQIRIGGGGGLEPAQRDLDPSSVTAALERLDPFDLLRLERLVDLEELERPLLLLHVA